MEARFCGEDGDVRLGQIAGLLARGFAEIINHNWPMALVLWQQALNNDPANRAIVRSVELAQWNVEYQKRGGREMTTRAARLDAARTDPVFAEIIGRMERDYKAEADQISAAQDWRIREQLIQESLRFTPR